MVGDALDPRVLEPSPPALAEPPWFADDPVAAGPGAGRPVVAPVPGADLTWDDWLREHPERAGWAADRWLGARRRLEPPPPGLAATRHGLHVLAVYAVSPARRRANGKIGLRWTLGGFGTPFFGADEQVRVAGATIVRQRGGTGVAAPVTTLAAAAALALDGPPDVAWAEGFEAPSPEDPRADLEVEPTAAAAIGEWFGFAVSVLEELRAEPASVAPSRVQLWPEHFDVAFDAGPEDRRVTFGASPGDDAEPEPYLYVLPPEGVPRNAVWNAETFRGAILRLPALLDADDQRATVLGLMRRARALVG